MKTWSISLLALVAACGSNPGAACPDEDHDGVTVCDGDCDDGDPLAFPGGNEICGDNQDNNCDGAADVGCSGIGTFVSALTGSAANPGTKASPVQTIGQGMANAATIGGPQTVVVAEGSYAEKVSLAEGVDLMGGFQCDAASCTWRRDPLSYDSLIANTDFEGVVAGAGITQATLVDGFHIVGKDGVPPAAPGSCGLIMAGGSPTLRGNRIVGGNVSGGGFGADRSIAVSVRSTTDPGGTLIDHNELTGGTSSGLSAGLVFDSYPASTTTLAIALGNVIAGGAGRRSVGVVAWNTVAGTTLSNNDILANDSNGGASHGIEVGSTMTIDSNRINVDQGAVGTCVNPTGWCAGIYSESSTTTITNNIAFGPKAPRSAGVFLGEFERAAGAVILNGNTLNGGGIGVLAGARTASAALVVSIGTCTMCGFAGFVGRVRNNILDGGNNLDRFGVREDPSLGRTMRPDMLDNNLFWFSPSSSPTLDVMYRQVDAQGVATDHTSVTAINALTTPACTGNISADPMLDSSWHLAAASPCVDQGTASEAPPADFEGQMRPMHNAVDIGHDELQ